MPEDHIGQLLGAHTPQFGEHFSRGEEREEGCQGRRACVHACLCACLCVRYRWWCAIRPASPEAERKQVGCGKASGNSMREVRGVSVNLGSTASWLFVLVVQRSTLRLAGLTTCNNPAAISWGSLCSGNCGEYQSENISFLPSGCLHQVIHPTYIYWRTSLCPSLL